MTIILKLKEPTENNSEHGYILDVFDTAEDFKKYLKVSIQSIYNDLLDDGTTDEEIKKMNVHSANFDTLFSKYLEYHIDETIQII